VNPDPAWVALGETIGRRTTRHERDGTFDVEGFAAVADLFGAMSPRDRIRSVLGLAMGSGDLGFAISAVAHLVGVLCLERFASVPEPLRTGHSLCSVANAERGAGTDVLRLAARAEPSGEGWRLVGEKWSITNVGVADHHLVSARVGAELGVWLLGPSDGWTAEPRRDLDALRTSPTGALTFDALVAPTARLGDGRAILAFQYAAERVLTAVLYLAALRIALDRGLTAATGREQFGRPIGDNQYVQGKLVDAQVACDLLSSRLEAVADDWRGDHLSTLKLFGQPAAEGAVRSVLGLLGGRGLSTDEPLRRIHRDLQGLSVLGGTIEQHRMVRWREMLARRESPVGPPRDGDLPSGRCRE
jgi:cyclohexanecarboxyl-CoA dehydrogenase